MARVQQTERPAGPEKDRGASPSMLAGASPYINGTRGELPLRIVAAKVSTLQRMREILATRELLVFLIRKELKVRYKSSFLGFLWSFLNPAMVLMIYFVVFRFIEHTPIQDFAIYLFCGLLPWNLFNTALLSASGTLVANAGIVKKVAFPREILAFAQVGVAACYFFFQTCILVLFLVGFQVMPNWRYLPELLLALLCDLVFSAALCLMLSALNVYMRDIEHLIQVVLVALFFAEPIVFPFATVGPRLAKHHLLWLFLANPLTSMVLAFQQCIYGHVKGAAGVLASYGGTFYLELLCGVLAASLLLFYLGMLLFRRVEGNFAEEL
ncbi:MAG: ABC transporter permease [Acidimicrobiales bacterium]